MAYAHAGPWVKSANIIRPYYYKDRIIFLSTNNIQFHFLGLGHELDDENTSRGKKEYLFLSTT
jgi:hypothetical protein